MLLVCLESIVFVVSQTGSTLCYVDVLGPNFHIEPVMCAYLYRSRAQNSVICKHYHNTIYYPFLDRGRSQHKASELRKYVSLYVPVCFDYSITVFRHNTH